METNETKMDVFKALFQVDVNEKVEKKNGLSYLSWAWAWSEVRKRYPSASYTILRNENNMPYFYDENCGIECRTVVTIENETHEMWLPVMDSANNPMFFRPTEVETRSGKRKVAAATMFDINKTIMRCLAKNLAMFGLGLYIYAGEDMPEEIVDENSPEYKTAKLIEEINKVVINLQGKHTKEEMMAIGNTIIKPIIGTVNYRKSTDVDKLEALLNKIKEVK